MSIKFDNVKFAYKEYNGDNVIFENLSFVIPTNEISFITGLSGTGKSTILKLIKGILRQQSGEIIKPKNTEIGLVFQHPEIQFFESTVKKEISFGLKNKKLKEYDIEKKLFDIVDKLELNREILEKSPFELSSGEKRIVAIASILIMQPKVLLLDEPTAALDGITTKKIMNLLKDLTKEGITVVIVSHNEKIIDKYSDNKIELKNRKELSNKNRINKIQTEILKIDSRLKLFVSIFLVIFTIIKPFSFYTYIYVSLVIILFMFIMNINVIPLMIILKPIAYTSMFILIFNMITLKTGNVIYQGFIYNQKIKIYDTPFIQTFDIFFQLLLISVIMIIVSLIINPSDMVEILINIFKPFTILIKDSDIKIEKISLLLTLSIQFIPIILREGEIILKSQENRGARKGIKLYISVLLPLFLRTMAYAQNLSDAMEIRNFIIGSSRSKYISKY